MIFFPLSELLEETDHYVTLFFVKIIDSTYSFAKYDDIEYNARQLALCFGFICNALVILFAEKRTQHRYTACF